MGREQFKDQYITMLPYATYKREEFIKFIRLTSEEFFLLPEDERIAYSDIIYGSLLDGIPSVGDKRGGMGFIDSYRFGPYFEARGCTLENYDFGIEEYAIARVREDNLTISDETFASLFRHLNTICKAKADAFEMMVIEEYPRLASDLAAGVEITFAKDAPLMDKYYKCIIQGDCYFYQWPGFVRETVLNGAMCAVMERLANGETVQIPNISLYRDMFSDDEYEKNCESEGNSKMILKKK